MASDLIMNYFSTDEVCVQQKQWLSQIWQKQMYLLQEFHYHWRYVICFLYQYKDNVALCNNWINCWYLWREKKIALRLRKDILENVVFIKLWTTLYRILRCVDQVSSITCNRIHIQWEWYYFIHNIYGLFFKLRQKESSESLNR